ncbi:MAG: hypothetical protein GF346_13385 [Candidatus Eisenbacteria bacterium]|nr:hypothetical protein [Candidatus Latescibacterota bacterium]MBD3303433.1 hypothetical protein [Candidatus Eisenbacteria bacterium]
MHRTIIARCPTVVVLALCRFLSAGPVEAAEGHPPPEECTIAVVAGSATPDGRPLLWKNRDAHEWSHEVRYSEGDGYAHVDMSAVDDTASTRIGINETGFAIINATANNLPDSLFEGYLNGTLMKEALRSCASLADFEQLLVVTGLVGRNTPSSMGVIDALGGAAIYEVGNHTFVGYDANDPQTAPDGFLVRANFGFSADTSGVSTTRFLRASALLAEAKAEDRLDLEALLATARDLWTPEVDPYPLPCDTGPPQAPHLTGYVDALHTLNRSKTVSFGVIHGIAPGEDPRLTTFYAAPGQPAVTPAFPVWVAAGPTPPELDGPLGSPLSDLSYERCVESYAHPIWRWWIHTNYLVHSDREDGFLVRVRQIEQWMLPEVAAHLDRWRTEGIDPAEIAAVQRQVAAAAFDEYAAPVSAPVSVEPSETVETAPQLLCRPNPARRTVRIERRGFDLGRRSVFVEIFDVSGRRIRRLPLPPAGTVWDGRNALGTPVAPGVYLIRPQGIPGCGSRPVHILP